MFAVDRDVGEGLKTLKQATVSELDVTSTASIEKFKNEIIKEEPLDLLLNIAGQQVRFFYLSTNLNQVLHFRQVKTISKLQRSKYLRKSLPLTLTVPCS